MSCAHAGPAIKHTSAEATMTDFTNRPFSVRISGVWRLCGSIHLDRYSIHVAIVPHRVSWDKAGPLVVLALGDLHAVDGEEDVLLAADRGNFAVVIHTPPTPYFSGHDASRIAHSGTGVGPVGDRIVNQPRYPTGKLAGVSCHVPAHLGKCSLVAPGASG